MKRTLALMLIALLLLCPLFAAHAEGGHVFEDIGLFSQEELDRLNARADELYTEHGVAAYFFYMASATELVDYTKSFAENDVPESDAIILGMNDDLYYIYAKGTLAEAVFTGGVKDTLWAAFSAVKDDPEGKVRAFFDAADEVLASYDAGLPAATEAPAAPDEPFIVPNYIALTAGGKPAVVDEAQLLTAAEAEALSKKLVAIGNAYRCDVVVVTVPSLGSKTSEEFADDFFDYNGYGYGATPDANGMTVDGDGALLLLSMEDRDFAISTSGYGITAFTDYGIQIYLEAQFLPYLRVNNYNDGFTAFADGCEYLLKTARDGEPFDIFTVSERTANGKPIIMDMAGLLDPDRIRTLSEKLKAIGDTYQCDVIFVTDADYRYDGEDAAQRYYTENGYGYRVTNTDGSTEDRGGILLFYSDRSGALSQYVAGAAQKAFKGRGLYQFLQAILSAIYAGSLDNAVETYAAQSEKYLNAASKGRAINPINVVPILLALGAGMLFGFIPVNAMKRQLTDVHENTNANTYLTSDSFRLTQNSDILLGTNVSRSVHVDRSSSSGGSGRAGGSGGSFHGGSSTHTSSSGGSHGGHSGKF